MTTIELTAGEELTLRLPDGRTAGIYYHTCPTCKSLDVWTHRGLDEEEVSLRTGDTTRAPVGLFAWRNGARKTVEWEPVAGSHGWPAVATVSLIWNDTVTPL